MNARLILIIGFFISLVYVTTIVYFQAVDIKSQKNDTKFLLMKKKDSLKIVSQIPKEDINSSLTNEIDKICNKYKCDKNILYIDKKRDIVFDDILEKLIYFIDENNISKASIITNGKKLDLDFLLHNKKELDSLRVLYKSYTKNFDINDKSSIIQIFSIADIEKSINLILNKEKIVIDSDTINFKTRRVLNQIFRKLKSLGSVSVELDLPIKEDKIEFLKNFIDKNYPWIKEIKIIKSDKKNIKIKEVLT